MYKMSYLDGAEWLAHTFPPVFTEPGPASASRGLVAGVPGGDISVVERLALSMEAPFHLLYVLHTSRGEGEPGRYQSPELSSQQLRWFLERFGAYLASDARFDIWVYSPSERATLVWDRHNRLFAYGSIERFASVLRSMGFSSGEPTVPSPHSHHYHQENDGAATELLAAFEWSYTPLREEDEQ